MTQHDYSAHTDWRSRSWSKTLVQEREMPKPALTYLTRRGNVYWFRMAVPSDLVERLGRREVKASLGTSSLAAARQRCQHLGSAVLQFIARIRSMPELSQETIKRLARRYFEQQLRSTEDLAYRIPSDPDIDQAFEAQDSLDEADRLRKSLAQRRYDAITKGVAAEVLTTEGLARKGLPLEDFDRLCLAVLRARIEAHRIYAAKLCGHYDDIAARDPLFAGIVSTEMPTLPGMPQELFARSIAFLIEKFLEMKRQSWALKTRLDNKTILDLFAEVVDAKTPIDAIGNFTLHRSVE